MSTPTRSVPRVDQGAPPPRPPRGARALRILGWTAIVAGAVVLLYVVYVLWFTGFETEREQSAMLEDWDRWMAEQGGNEPAEVPGPGSEMPGSETPGLETPGDDPAAPRDPEAPGGGSAPALDDAVAVLAFERPGAAEPPVRDDRVAVVDGVGVNDLQRGPGHYPDSATPGEDGNFAVAGHRVTHSAPFHDLDELEPGDEVHVWDRDGAHHVYAVKETQVVAPTESWVLGADPLDSGRPTLTLTTCHPRYSDRERLVAFAELIS